MSEWWNTSEPSWWAFVYIAGDVETIRTVCREHCFPTGLCVTVEAVDFVFGGGMESGARVGLIQYPRFPTDTAVLLEKAKALGIDVCERNQQWSFTIVTPKENLFYSRREHE